MEILITNVDDIESFMQSDEFKLFDDHCREYQEQVLERCLKPLSDSERIEFLAWWGSMQWEGFWDSLSEPAYIAINTAISWGLG